MATLQLSTAPSDWPLHEVRVSPGTLDALGAHCFEWLDLHGVPCCVSVESAISNGSGVAPTWMLRQLESAGVSPRACVVRRSHPTDANRPVVAADQLVLAPVHELTDLQGATDCPGRRADSEEWETTWPSTKEPDEPFNADSLRSLRRQLLGMPLRVGSACAVQRLHGVCLLRVVRWDGGEDRRCIGRATAVTVERADARTERRPQPWPQHGAAPLGPLMAHVHALLSVQTQADSSSRLGGASGEGSGGPRDGEEGQRSLVAALAAGGGHALLCGPAGNGKQHALCRMAAHMQ